jgi:glycosyltransferase
VFAGLNADAALPRMQTIIDDYKPDLVLREPAEFSSYVMAVRRGIEQVNVAIGMWRVDESMIESADQRLVQSFDVSSAPIRQLRTLSLSPPTFDRDMPATFRPRDYYRDDTGHAEPSLPGAWAAAHNEHPLVYVTFGSVAANLGSFDDVYRVTLDALADMQVRVLLTVGEGGDPDRLTPWPANAHIERWWPQESILPAASLVVGHGGFGTTMGALRAGIPQVVVPLFALDQFLNADAVDAAGAGIAVREPSKVAIADAVRTALTDERLQHAAGRLADEIRALPLATAWLAAG